jgi:fatty-acyl-CoA synthase
LIEGIAARDKRRRWTFPALLADSERVARAILSRFSPGDHVAVWAANSPAIDEQINRGTYDT